MNSPNTKNNTSARPDKIIWGLTLFLLILFTGVIVILVIFDYLSGYIGPLTSEEPVFNNSLLCPENFCATNLLSGEKRCPAENQNISVNPNFEVCNPKFGCTSSFTPYAQNNDGSTNTIGQCPDNVACNCYRNPRCAEYVTSYFQLKAGDPFDPENRSRVILQQKNFYDSGNMRITNPPFSFSDPSTNFCTIPLDWINDSTPGCQTGTNFEDLEILQACFNLANKNCNSSSVGSPCLSGVLTFIPNSDLDTWLSNFPENSRSTPVACVRGTLCDCNEISVWDNSLGTNYCFLPPNN